jgi:hypothetical protein
MTDIPLLPSGWELVSRIAMTVGVAGLVGAAGRLLAGWLRSGNKSDPP